MFKSKNQLTSWLLLNTKRVRDYLPFTGPGIALFALGLLSFSHFAIDQSDFFVRASIVVFLYLYLMLSLVTMVIRYFVKRRLKKIKFRCEHSQAVRGQRLHLENITGGFKVYPLVEVSVRSRKPERYIVDHTQHAKNQSIVLLPKRRGRIDHLEFTFVVSDIFGLNRTLIRHDLALNIEVHAKRPVLETPHLHLPNEGDDAAHPAGSFSGDYVDMRRYAPGDPQRFILWKAFARSRKLLVRTPERAESKEPAIALILLTSPQDSEAADVARYFLEQSNENLVFGAAGLKDVAFNMHDALGLLKTSGELKDVSVTSICETLQPILKNNAQRVVVIASPEDLSMPARLDQLVGHLQVTPHVILASSATASEPTTGWQRFGILNAPDSGSRFNTLCIAINALRETHRQFEVINPKSGRRWEANQWHL